ncbi:MAG: hypothetical protein M3H12_09345 [Chromatiales bacterium]
MNFLEKNRHSALVDLLLMRTSGVQLPLIRTFGAQGTRDAMSAVCCDGMVRTVRLAHSLAATDELVILHDAPETMIMSNGSSAIITVTMA